MATSPDQYQDMNEPAEAGFFMPEDVADGYEQLEDEEQSDPRRLMDFIESPNIAADLTDEELGEIGQRVVREYQIDEDSRAEWLQRTKTAMELAAQVAEEKSYPWPKAANIKFPLMTTAAIQFNARAYPAVVAGKDVVKGKPIGADLDGQKKARAERIGKHMSFQLTDEMTEWEDDTDKLLLILPIVGSVFRKTYWSQVLQRNVSELVLAEDCVVNYKAKSLERAPRVTHKIEFYPHEITERVRGGTFIECDLGMAEDADGDEDAPHLFLEQHRLLDLDEDGYPEPYVVTVHEQTAKVVRIVANYDAEGVQLNAKQQVVRVQPVAYFTHYQFMPSADGGFYGTGLGRLLGPLNESVNTTLNMLLDAGHLQNVGGGFIGKGLRMKKGAIRFSPGEWHQIESPGMSIRENMVPLPVAGPSPVLFQLLGLLIEAGREIASIKDVMTGDADNMNAPATTTMALIEQGMKVYSAIFKRLHRALKQELSKLYRLNRLYLPPQAYFTVLDEQQAISQQDYAQDVDVVPVTDPTEVSEAQKLARAQALVVLKDDPRVDGVEILRRYFEATGQSDVDKLMAPKQEGPDPATTVKIAELEIKERELEMKEAESAAKIKQILADAMNAIADAEAKEVGAQLEIYRAQVEQLTQQLGVRNGTDGAAGVSADAGGPGMAQPPGDGGLPPLPVGAPGMAQGAMGAGGGELPQPGGDGAQIL